MDPREFEREIASPERKTFYLVAGDDPAATRHCAAAAKAAVDQGLARMNFRQYHADDLNKGNGWIRMEAEAAANPFGRPPRVILAKVGAGDKLPAEAVEALTRLKSRINPAVTLVLFIESVPANKVFKELAEEGREVDCRTPSGPDLIPWLIGRFAAKGAVITPEGARAMIDRAGGDPGVLEGEAEKLSLFPGADGPIGPAEVRRWVSLSPTAEIYELGTPLASGRLGEALPTMMDLLGQASPISLMYPLGAHFRRLLKLQSLIQARGGEIDDQALAAACGVKIGFMRYARPQLRIWTMGRLKMAMAAIAQAHKDLVTVRADGRMVFQELVVKLGVLAGGG